MNRRQRLVDAAMDADRPEKNTVRQLWAAEAAIADARAGGEDTLYLTLSGAHGKDIDRLIEAGLLLLTESGAVSEAHKFRVVAVESNGMAVRDLQRKFPGLKIIEQPFQDMIRGPEPFAWPTREEEQYCRALVVNLDLNRGLSARAREGQITFPVIGWVAKVAQLHCKAPRKDWTLCLTLHGQIGWDDEVAEFAQRFLAQNFTRDVDFARGCELVLGPELCEMIRGTDVPPFRELEQASQQATLMVFVPKFIISAVQSQGWTVEITHSLIYGSGKAAPMVTWVCRFHCSMRAIDSADVVYRDGLASIVASAGAIADDGKIKYIVNTP